MKQLIKYFKLQKEIYEYFGYKEDWKIIPLTDSTNVFWCILNGEENSSVRFSESKYSLLSTDNSKIYEHEIYTQRFLSKYVYRGKDYTMICVDTNVDGNKFLQVFSNKNEIKESQIKEK
jgi:hypothetical protein